MPSLFISYKRDDKVAVMKIVERLRRDFYFDVWIDAESIPGGEDWRAEIQKGIDKCDVVLLMLTPDACMSLYVKDELDYARGLTPPCKIMPLQIRSATEEDMAKLAVGHINFIDFTIHDERFAWEKLIDDLPPVLERDRRRLDPTFNALHQDYLRTLFTRYDRVKLSYLLDAAPREAVSLLDVYVPLFLGINFWADVQNN